MALTGLRLGIGCVSHAFKKRPLVTNITSFGVLSVSAELTRQFLEKKLLNNNKPTEKLALDWETASKYAIVGTAGIGPILFYWFRTLDKWLPSRAPKHVILKCIVDQVVSSPACLFIFFVGMSALEGKIDILEEFRKKFWSTYVVSCCFWPTAQVINFGLLAAHTRVAFVGAASFLWSNILCLVKGRNVKTQKELLPRKQMFVKRFLLTFAIVFTCVFVLSLKFMYKV